VIFFSPLILKDDCLLQEEGRIEANYIHYTCPSEEYNPLATILLNPENAVIKAFMNQKAVFNYESLIIYFCIWYFFTVITYGTSVPAGIFLPGILIGCALGRMVGLFIDTYIF
jgi:chloride channel 7